MWELVPKVSKVCANQNVSTSNLQFLVWQLILTQTVINWWQNWTEWTPGSDLQARAFDAHRSKSQISQKHVAAHTRLGEKCILLEIGPRWLGKRGHWGLRWFGGDQHSGCHLARCCWARRWGGGFLYFILFCITANSNSIVSWRIFHTYQKHQTLSVADDITQGLVERQQWFVRTRPPWHGNLHPTCLSGIHSTSSNA